MHAEETFVRFLVIAAFCGYKWPQMAFVGGHFSAKNSSAHITFTLFTEISDNSE